MVVRYRIGFVLLLPLWLTAPFGFAVGVITVNGRPRKLYVGDGS